MREVLEYQQESTRLQVDFTDGLLNGECRSFYPVGYLQMCKQWQPGLRHSLSEQIYLFSGFVMRVLTTHNSIMPRFCKIES